MVQGHYFGGLCFLIWFDYFVIYPVVFWGLDVALKSESVETVGVFLFYFELI